MTPGVDWKLLARSSQRVGDGWKNIKCVGRIVYLAMRLRQRHAQKVGGVFAPITYWTTLRMLRAASCGAPDSCHSASGAPAAGERAPLTSPRVRVARV